MVNASGGTLVCDDEDELVLIDLEDVFESVIEVDISGCARGW